MRVIDWCPLRKAFFGHQPNPSLIITSFLSLPTQFHLEFPYLRTPERVLLIERV